jgi:hypothetical protein
MVRDLVIVPEVGMDQCGAVELAMEVGEGRYLSDVCLNPTVGYLTAINTGICETHIALAESLGGAFVLE